MHAAVHVDLQVDRDAGGGRGVRSLPGALFAVGVGRHADAAAGHVGHVAPLLLAEDRVREGDVVDAGGRERLGLGVIFASRIPRAPAWICSRAISGTCAS